MVASCRAALALLLAATPAFAQNVLSDPLAIQFSDIAAAEMHHWHRVAQFRFAKTVDATGVESWVGLVEDLQIAPSNTPGIPRFDLQLRTSVGLDVAEEARQRATHAEHRGFLHLHSSFFVHDPVQAAANFSIQFDRAVVTLGRPAYRVQVLSNTPGANSWVLELDIETGYALSRIEYAPSGELVSMLVATSFLTGPAARPTPGKPMNWWQPPHRTWYDGVDVALVKTGIEARAIKSVPDGFAFHDVSVTTDPVRGERTLVVAYTNGVDTIHLLQVANAPRPSLAVVKNANTHTILDFSDLTTAQFLFHAGNIRFTVVGAAHNDAASAFAEDVLREVLP